MKRDSLISPIVWGGLILILGFGFLLDGFSVIDFGNFIGTYWPMIIVVFAVAELFKRNLIAALILGVIGISLQVNELDKLSVNVWNVIWPCLLIIIGSTIIYRAVIRMSNKNEDPKENISSSAVLGESIKNVTSKNFKTANVNGVLGSNKLNLQKATLSKEGATIDVLAILGGVEIIVPKEMPVNFSTTNILGGAEDKRDQSAIDNSKPALKITGLAMLGGIEVKN